ncbi:hypothetical protein ACFFOO_05005, partial [Mucilaginibacter ginsenosidivorans]
MKFLNKIGLLVICVVLGSCTRKSTLPPGADVLHANEDALTQVIIYDVFTPPVASRIYGYTN